MMKVAHMRVMMLRIVKGKAKEKEKKKVKVIVVNSDNVKMAADLDFFRVYPWGKEPFGLTLNYLKKKIDLTKQKEAYIKRNNASYALYGFPWAFGYMRPFLIWEGTTKRCDYPDFISGGRGPRRRFGCHNYVSSLGRACDHAGLSGLKTTPDDSNDDDLRKRVSVLEKSVLDIASFVRDERLRRIKKNKKKQRDEVHLDSPLRSRHQVNLEKLAVVVTNIAAANEKAEKEKKVKETEEKKATDEQDAKEEEDEEEE
ncbi:hypothetical protein FXO37_13875 [Capsicum annuum]|nr:hypothetical protein FXO37_13875 [Capsicum annuum]